MAFINNPQNIRIERREWYDHLQNDIAPHPEAISYEKAFLANLCELDDSPLAVRYFAANCDRLSDWLYWLVLGACWVQYSGFTDLAIWRRLFLADRPKRDSYLMKPTERRILRRIVPQKVHCFRAARAGEKDWISLTLDSDTARKLAAGRPGGQIREYLIPKKDIAALFLRRGEYEVLCLDSASIYGE